MADRIQFTSVELLKVTRKPDGGTILFSAAMSKSIQTAMGWTEIPECFTGADLDGELAAPQIELTPNDEALKRHAMTIDSSLIYKFQSGRSQVRGIHAHRR